MAETEHIELVKATGLAIALIGVLLEGKAVVPKDEFSRRHDLLAGRTRPTSKGLGSARQVVRPPLVCPLDHAGAARL